LVLGNAFGHRPLADDARIGGLKAANPLRRQCAFSGEFVSPWSLGEKIGEGAVGLTVRIEQAEDAVETIPVVFDVDESATVGLEAVARNVAQRESPFAKELPRDRSPTVDKLGAKLDRRGGTGVSDGVYSSTDAFARLENDGAQTSPV
jgi:hypothetical protein